MFRRWRLAETISRRRGRQIEATSSKSANSRSKPAHTASGCWLDQEFGWKQSTAYNYMSVAERMPDFQGLGNVTREALYLLAGPSVPDEMRQTAIDRAEAGERITKAEAEAMLAERFTKSDRGNRRGAVHRLDASALYLLSSRHQRLWL